MAITATLSGMLRLSGLPTGSDDIPFPSGTFTASVQCQRAVSITTAFQTLAALVGTVPAGTTGVVIIPTGTLPVATNNISYGVSATVAEVLQGGTNPLPFAVVGWNTGLAQGLQMTGAGAATITALLVFF